MLRAATTKVIRQGALTTRFRVPLTAPQLQEFHVSFRREEESKPEVAVEKVEEGSWTPLYGVSLGIALAVPAIQYEWYLVNEETQLAACFICFCGVVYKQFGGVIYEALEEDGKRVLAETNAAEDSVIRDLDTAIKDIESQAGIVEDLEGVKQLKIETYEKLNAVGKVKPSYNFKAQVEKLLTVIESEEASSQEKGKMALMEEATAAVTEAFATNKELKKQTLANAVAMLKGTKTGADPVKEAYLKFFADKKKAAESLNEADEAKESREAMIAKLNAVAKNDKFYFEFDGAGVPKMVA